MTTTTQIPFRQLDGYCIERISRVLLQDGGDVRRYRLVSSTDHADIIVDGQDAVRKMRDFYGIRIR